MRNNIIGNIFTRMLCLFAMAFFTTALYATQIINLNPPPRVQINTPHMQPGELVSEFELPLSIENIKEETSVEIHFQKSAFIGSVGLDEPRIDPVTFVVEKDEVVYIKPVFFDDGIFGLIGTVNINGVESYINIYLLKIEDHVYYGGGTNGSVLESIVNYNLKDNREYNELLEKARRQQFLETEAIEKKARAKNRIIMGKAPLFNNDPSGKARYEQIRKEELKNIKRKINFGEQINKNRAKEKISANENVEVSVEWPANSRYTALLPLRGVNVK